MRPVLLLILLLFFSGCAHRGISDEAIRLVDRSLTFPLLKENPEQAVGSHAYLGGTIARVANYPEGGELEVVEQPLSRTGKPNIDAPSQGRFLARSSSFLDPLIHKPGTKVALVGEVKGHTTRALDNVQYRYPVLVIKELHLWRPEEQLRRSDPAVHFGLGFGVGF